MLITPLFSTNTLIISTIRNTMPRLGTFNLRRTPNAFVSQPKQSNCSRDSCLKGRDGFIVAKPWGDCRIYLADISGRAKLARR